MRRTDVVKQPHMEPGVSAHARGEPPGYPIESVDNALTLLLMFRERDEMGVAEASSAIGVARSTAHRLLAMLQWHGLIAQDPRTKTYRSGPTLVEIGVAALGRLDVRTVARPLLEELQKAFDETVHLVLPRGRDVFFIDAIESSRHLRVAERVGATLPAHCTSVGKALLAGLPDEALRTLYPLEKLGHALTGDSLSTRKALLQELALVRKRGYATNMGESEAGVGSVGAAIDKGDGPIAALSIAAPASRLTDERMDEFATEAVATAKRIADRLRA